MAKERMIDTKFWSDGWVTNKLNPLDRYLFLYVLTNEHTNLCGIYELPLRILAFETGIDEDELSRNMLKKLEPKAFYLKNSEWIWILNFERYHSKNPKTKIGVEIAKSLIPSHVWNEIKELCDSLSIAYPYPIDSLSPSASASASAINTDAKHQPLIEKNTKTMKTYDESKHSDCDIPVVDLETGEIPAIPKKTSKNKLAMRSQEYFIDQAKKNGMQAIPDARGYFLILDMMKKANLDAKLLKQRIDDWFASGIPAEDMVSITRCFSARSIEQWKVNNGIK